MFPGVGCCVFKLSLVSQLRSYGRGRDVPARDPDLDCCRKLIAHQLPLTPAHPATAGTRSAWTERSGWWWVARGIITTCFQSARKSVQSSFSCSYRSHGRNPPPEGAALGVRLPINRADLTAEERWVALSLIPMLHTSHAQLDARAHAAP